MKPQLLAPAGNLEKLKFAVAYGADAVYFGTEFGSLRSFAGNFNLAQAETGLNYLHANGKKGYVTLNIYPFSDEYEKIIDTAKTLDALGADAFIVADIGVLSALKNLNLKADLHISTQANTTSYQAALAYKPLGAKRVNLARELSIDQVEQIQSQLNGQMETEVFIHGAVCFSYSGRCAISDYLTGFAANHGQCKHPCRWSYSLMEEKRPGQFMPVFEDQKGLYLFNSKDLALYEFVPRLASAGVTSFKIEGRMKSIHYIASAVSFYRQIIDGKIFSKQQADELLNRIPNRGYTQGFMKGDITSADYKYQNKALLSDAIFIANVLEEKQDGKTILEVRNKIFAGDQLEVLSPDGQITQITMPSPLTLKDGQPTDFANNSQFLLLDTPLPVYTILRKIHNP